MFVNIKLPSTTKFYTFNQNNSGGYFDEKDGLAQHVIIEATSSLHANEIAMKIGIYFKGCSMDVDCDCCGDRWYPVDGFDGAEVPSIYGREVYSKEIRDSLTRFDESRFIVIHYLDGKVEYLD